MIKRIFAFILLFIIFTVQADALSEDDVSAECAAVISVQSGRVVFGKNENQKHSMASTTKIMTSLLAVESGKLQSEIKVTDSMVQVEGTSMGLMGGDSVSLRELVYGMLLPSGNDAANVTALYLGGNIESFVKMMNERGQEIGMVNTSFVTPSGLDDENHYSTACDMALLGREAVKNPEFLKICSSSKATLTYGNPPYERTLYNHNRLLGSYDGCLGIKTGFTKKSGRCLVTYARRNGVGLVAVTLNDKNDWYDHRQMLDYGFSVVQTEEVIPELPETVDVAGGEKGTALVKAESLFIEKGTEKVEYRYILPKFLYAPVNSGDVAGEVQAYSDGVLIQSVPVTVCEDIKIKRVEIKPEEKSVLQKIKEFFHG